MPLLCYTSWVHVGFSVQVRGHLQQILMSADHCFVKAATRSANSDSLALELMAQTCAPESLALTPFLECFAALITYYIKNITQHCMNVCRPKVLCIL